MDVGRMLSMDRKFRAGARLGGCYAAFLDAQGIEPLRISDEIKQRYRKHPYPSRVVDWVYAGRSANRGVD